MINDFQFFVFNARDPRPFAAEVATKTYEMWRGVWLPALSELDGATDLKSDDFTRQEKVGALLQNGVAVGCMFFSKVDLAQAMWRKDSYFSAWPEPKMIELGQRYSQIEVCSWFTLSQNYRRASNGFNGKQLLGALGFEHWRRETTPAMVGTMRVNRGMHTLCYDLNAKPIEKGLHMHGVEVDLILFDRQHFSANPSLKGPMTDEAKLIYSASLEEWNEKVSGLRKAA